jgi:hypothetical protein
MNKNDEILYECECKSKFHLSCLNVLKAREKTCLVCHVALKSEKDHKQVSQSHIEAKLEELKL